MTLRNNIFSVQNYMSKHCLLVQDLVELVGDMAEIEMREDDNEIDRTIVAY